MRAIRSTPAALFALIACIQIALAPAALAAEPEDSGPIGRTGFSLSNELTGSSGEYVSGNYPGAILMRVNLWGAMSKPGIHNVPARTDLVTFLALAGGPSSDAELDDITIKRRSGQKEEILRIDAEELLTETGGISPMLEPNDIILVPRSQPPVHPNTIATLAFAGQVIGLVLSAVALSAVISR